MLAFLGLKSPLEFIAAQHRLLSTRRSRSRHLNVTDGFGLSPLMYAFLGNQKRTVQFLVQVGAKLNPQYSIRRQRWTLLTLSSRNPDPEFIEMLFPRGIKISNRMEGIFTLHFAIDTGNARAAKMLLDRGVAINAPKCTCASPFKECEPRYERFQAPCRTEWNMDYLDSCRAPPLHRAIKSGNEDIARILLDNGANVHAQDTRDSKPLAYVFWFLQQPTKFALMLLDRGADPNVLLIPTHEHHIFPSMDRYHMFKESRTPLQFAIKTNDKILLRKLIDRGANKHAQDFSGRSPLYYAASNGRWEMFKMILDSGADPNVQESDGKPLLHFAVTSLNRDAVLSLIRMGVDVNWRCPRGTTALHWARTSEIAESLIEAGLNIESRDCMGCTPLHFAANRGNAEVVATLLKKGADANIDAKSVLGETPLHHAGSPEVVKLLVEAGAKLESRDRWGRTPLYQAAHRQETLDFGKAQLQDFDIIKMLRWKGADENAEDYIGESAVPDAEMFLVLQPRPPPMPPSFHTTGLVNVG